MGLGQISDLLGKLLELFLTALALGSSDTSLHLLNLEIGVVEQLLLTGLLVFELGDVGLQVTASRQSTADVTDQVGLLGSQFEQLLRFFEKLLFLLSDLLFNFVAHVFGLLEFLLGHLVHLLELFLGSKFLSETFFGRRELFLGGVETLHLLRQDGVDRSNINTFVIKLGGESGKLIS